MRGVFADLLGESGIVVQGRNNGRVRGTPRRRRPAWPSQCGDFEVSVPASGSDRGWPRGQTETVENLVSDGRILNSGQNTHPAAAAWTFQHIHGEGTVFIPASPAVELTLVTFSFKTAVGSGSQYSHWPWSLQMRALSFP